MNQNVTGKDAYEFGAAPIRAIGIRTIPWEQLSDADKQEFEDAAPGLAKFIIEDRVREARRQQQ
jgi:hypothetical protein